MNANQLARLQSYERILETGTHSISELARKAQQYRQTTHADISNLGSAYFKIGEYGEVIQIAPVPVIAKSFAANNPTREAINQKSIQNKTRYESHKYPPLTETELIDYPVTQVNEAIRPLIKSPDDVVKLIRFLIAAYEASSPKE